MKYLVIMLCPLLVTQQGGRASEYYARRQGWVLEAPSDNHFNAGNHVLGRQPSHTDRGTYNSGTQRVGSSETQSGRGSYSSGSHGWGSSGTYGSRGSSYSASQSLGASGTGISSRRCLETRATSEFTACEKTLREEFKKVPRGSSEYRRKLCCVAASTEKCYERVVREAGCEQKAQQQVSRSRQWMQQHLGSIPCTYNCGQGSGYSTSGSSSYNSGYGTGYGTGYRTGYGTSYGTGHGGYGYRYGAGATAQPCWATAAFALLALPLRLGLVH